MCEHSDGLQKQPGYLCEVRKASCGKQFKRVVSGSGVYLAF